jgi:hypothetical protein
MTDLQTRARAELERRKRQPPGVIRYDPDGPEEPEKSLKEARPFGAGVPFLCPEEQDEEELKAANRDV